MSDAVQKELISVIVPVYNVEKYLPKCIESILAQTYMNWELLLIDDGSPDNSGIICDNYAERDNRIRVIHKKNEGVSSARNLGIDKASGNFIMFVDSDDWIENDYLSNFGDLSSIGNDVLILQGVERISNITNKTQWIVQYENKLCYGEEINKMIAEYELLHSGFPVAKLFSKELIIKNNIRFNTTISFHEDHLFVFEYWKYINKLKITSSISYKYIDYEDNQSLSSKKHFYAESEIAYKLINDSLNSLLNQRLIYDDYIKKINHFVFQIRIEGLLFCYLMENKKTRLNYLKTFKKEKSDVKSEYNHRTIAGRVLKICLIYVPLFIVDKLIVFYLFVKNHKS